MSSIFRLAIKFIFSNYCFKLNNLKYFDIFYTAFIWDISRHYLSYPSYMQTSTIKIWNDSCSPINLHPYKHFCKKQNEKIYVILLNNTFMVYESACINISMLPFACAPNTYLIQVSYNFKCFCSYSRYTSSSILC